MPPPLLKTVDLTRQVGGVTIVDHVSLEVQEGEVLAVTGPSGAGKSSLLRLLNRLDEPTSGTVLLEGKDYRSLPPRRLRRLVGMMMQSPHLFPGTVADNLKFGPAQVGKTLERDQVRHLLEGVGLPGFEDRDVATLSGGEAQRVALARALANEPRILLLDEPTSALDTRSMEEVEALVFAVARNRGLTCIIVTHNIDQAMRVAHRAVVMEAGRAVKHGPVREVLHA